MKDLLKEIKKKARGAPKRIVFPEGEEDRTLKAIRIILKEKTAMPILLGNIDAIRKKCRKLGIDANKIKIINPIESKEIGAYAKKLFGLRKNKGISLEDAKTIIKSYNYFGTMMVYCNDADGLISGAIHATGETLKPALEIIKTRKKFHRISGVFIMILKDKILFFADSAVNINPDAKDLAEIAIDTAETAKSFGIAPRIAMLSFSTHGSAKHPLVDKVKEATEIVMYKRPKLIIDGEIQMDAAIDKEVCKIKCPDCRLHGNANILIFPDLQSGNICYKTVERFTHARAIGPIIQGLKKPVNDLSRGCSVKDIVDMAAVTVLQAQSKKILYNYNLL